MRNNHTKLFITPAAGHANGLHVLTRQLTLTQQTPRLRPRHRPATHVSQTRHPLRSPPADLLHGRAMVDRAQGRNRPTSGPSGWCGPIEACIANERKATNGSLDFQAFGFPKRSFIMQVSIIRFRSRRGALERLEVRATPKRRKPQEFYPPHASVIADNRRVVAIPGADAFRASLRTRTKRPSRNTENIPSRECERKRGGRRKQVVNQDTTR